MKKKLLSIWIILMIALGLLIPTGIRHAAADVKPAEPQDGVVLETEEIDPESLCVPLLGETVENDSKPEENDPEEIVRVSIFLEGDSTIDRGFSVKGIAKNVRATDYRRTLESQQKVMQTKIEDAVGHDLDVQWNLTLLTNAISVDIPYRDIAVIEAIPGVRSVERENVFEIEPDVPNGEEEDEGGTRTAETAQNMVGAKALWDAGYTGAGTRIAIIDTGIDDTHQSFDEDAFLHAIEEDRANGKTVVLMDQIDNATLNQLNAKQKMPSLTAEASYTSAKIPFAFNYADKNTVTDHLHDNQGNHGSHVAGIAAANRYIKNGDIYEDAFSTVQAIGMAPDAQLIVMKTLGSTSAGESAVFAAIEDALILECDAINISLLGVKPGFSYASDSYQQIMNRLAEGGSADTVVSICAGNSTRVSTTLYIEDVSQHTGASPGTYINSMCVASSTKKEDREKSEITNGSSWGVPGSLLLKPEIAAPGQPIYSVIGSYWKSSSSGGEILGGPDQYGNKSGTSMAAPHIAGLSALLTQYFRENPIENEALTGRYSQRAINQSILMSTATPMKSYNKYIPVLQQGAGLVEVSKAISAPSVIMMDDAYLTTATGGANDGKIKVELGDDPQKTGQYTYSFEIYNTSDYPLEYTFHTDLFTQAIESGKYLGKNTTTGLNATVTHTLTTDAGTITGSHDVDRDGDTDNDDARAILAYLTGEADGPIDLSAADMDQDGTVTSYDAHLLIDWTPEENEPAEENVVPAHGKANVTVSILLNDSRLDNYPNGAYIEGFTFATCNSTAENGTDVIDLSHEHTIPVLGFYGNWTDPSMFDCVTYAEKAYTDKIAYSGQDEINIFTMQLPNGKLIKFAGNPYMTELSFPRGRLAVNSETVISKIDYMLLRTAGTVGLGGGKVDPVTGEYIGLFQYMMMHDQSLNGMVGIIARNNGTARSRSVGRTPASYGVSEGDRFRLGIYAFPEYTVMKTNPDMTAAQAGYFSSIGFSEFVKTGQYGDGVFFGYDFSIDDTAPTIGTVTQNGGILTVEVSDNQNVAYAALRSLDGETVYAETAPGAQQAAVALDATAAISDGITNAVIFVADYAANETAVSVRLSGNKAIDTDETERDDPESAEAGSISAPADEMPDAVRVNGRCDAIPGRVTALIGAETERIEGPSKTADLITVPLTENEATTNGFFTVSYDPDRVTFAGATGIEQYCSIKQDPDAGTVKIAYAAKEEIAPGETLAVISFSPSCENSEVFIVTTERGSNTALNETAAVEIEGTGHNWGTPTYTWSPDNKKCTAKAVCTKDPGHVITETVNTTVETTAPGCTETGENRYTAVFTNPAFTTQSRTVTIPATGHTLEPHAATAATCEAPGNSAYWSCSVCGKYFGDAEGTQEIAENSWVIAASGHNWGTPTYTWSSDNKKCTAKAVCTKDPGHILTETVNTTVETTSPGCTEAGENRYTAVFTNPAFTIQSRTVTIPATGHDWKFVDFTWAEDNTAVANYECKNDATHKQTVNATVTSVTTDATCEAAGSTVYTAKVTAANSLDGTEHTDTKTVTIPATGHDWKFVDFTWAEDNTAVANYECKNDATHKQTVNATVTSVTTDATCEAAGSTVYTATVTAANSLDGTGHTDTKMVTIPTTGHDWGTPTYTWSSDNKKVTAKAVCKKDASHVVTETVSTTYKVTKEPAPGVAGVGTYTATFKNEPFKTQTKNETIPALANKKATVEVKESDVQFSGSTPYRVYNGKAQTPGYIVKDEKGNVIPASKYKAEYKENVKAGTAYIFITFPNKDYTDCRTFFKIYLPATTWTKVENVENGIKVSWTKVEDAAGYVVYRRAWNLVDSGWTKFERWNNTTATSWIDTKVYAGTRYQYGVKAYFAKRTDPVSHAQIGGALDNYNLGLVGPLKTTVRITTRTLNSVTPGSKKLTVKWSGSSVFTGYQVQVATDAKFTQNLKTVTINDPKTYEKTVSGLNAKTTYYVRVRSIHVFEGTMYYGGWSNVMNAKTK